MIITPSAHAGATDSSTIETLRAPFRINTDTFRGQVLPKTTTLTSGAFAGAWRDSSDPQQDEFYSDIKVQLLAPDGAKLGDAIAVNTNTDGTQDQHAITGLAGGGFVVTWWTLQGGQKLSVQIFDAAGGKVGGEFDIYEGNFSEKRIYPAVAAADDGGFVIVYSTYTSSAAQDGGTYEMRLQRYSATGGLVGSEVTVNSVVAGGQQVWGEIAPPPPGAMWSPGLTKSSWPRVSCRGAM